MEGLRGLWETLKELKHQGPQPKLCPQCRGKNIYPTSSLGGLLPTIYHCEDCNYEGHLVFEVEPEEESKPTDV